MNRENMVLPPKNWPLIYRFYGEGLPHGLLKAGKESSCKFFKLFSVIKYVKTALKSFMSNCLCPLLSYLQVIQLNIFIFESRENLRTLVQS